MADLPTRACWEAEDARIILANEALERNDPVFLATHSPVEKFQVGGSHGSEIIAHTEQGLLDALSSPSTHHAFCVVEGDPGSGKSHLIRWLSVRWPQDEPLRPLLIQRMDGSLQGTLQQLQRALPEEHQHLFEQIGRPQDSTLAGRAGLFLKTLAQSLRPNFFVNPPEDAEWCAQFGLAELLDSPALIDQWKAPERIIELLSGKKGERDQELARFNLKDIASLEQLLRPLRAPTAKAVRFKNELKKEADAIRQLTVAELADPGAQEELRRRFDYSYKLVDALNERHNSAVQNVLGISSDGLKELFLRLRRELRDRRLVLLLEDITAWEGVDRQLIDVLVTNVETRQEKDLCPMVSVVGVTPAYFHNRSFQANYIQRITHHIQLGNPGDSRGYEEASALRTPHSQISFAARYLRATRGGVKRLSEWNGGPDPVPNRCDTCLHKEPCHREFGHHEGIGLFPFTKDAITRLYRILRDPQHAATYQTPRGMLQGVLSPTLQHPPVLDAGEYPGPEIETSLIRDEDRGLFEHGLMADVLENIADERTRERMRRLVAYWGKKGNDATRTLKDGDGALIYGGVRQGVYQAFGLPWLGGDGEGDAAHESNAFEFESDEDRPPPSPKDLTKTRDGKGTDGTSGQGDTTKKPDKSDRRRMSTTELVRLRQDIERWGQGKKPERASELNRIAYEVVGQLNWDHLAVNPWIRARLFTSDTVILRDTKPARSPYLVLDRESWVKKGIEAYYALRTGTGDISNAEAEAYRRAFANMLRKVRPLVSTKVRERLPCLENRDSWDILGAAAQVLLVRAWLRGDVSPLAASATQWRSIICEEPNPSSNPQDRVDSWKTTLETTHGIAGTLRGLLRTSLSLPQYQPDPEHENPDTSLALVANGFVRALRELPQTFRLLPRPESTQGLGEKLSELKRLAEVADALDQRLRSIPRYEVDRLVRQAKALEGLCRRSSIRHHLQRVDSVIETVAGHFPNELSEPAQVWRRARQILEGRGFLEEGTEYAGATAEAFMDLVADEKVPSSDERAQALAWSLDAPVNTLQTVYDFLDTAEQSIRHYLRYVEEYIGANSEAPGTMGDVHHAGSRIQDSANKAIRDLGNSGSA